MSESNSEVEIQARVVSIVRQTSAVAAAEITGDTDLVLDLAFDSLRIAELAAGLEETFDRSFDLPEWVYESGGRHSLTVGSLVSFTVLTLRANAP